MEFIVDETLVKVGSEYIWIWIVIEPEDRQILLFLANKSKERNMLIAERFLSGVVKIHGKYPLSPDGGTWYPQACRFLGRTSYSILFGEKHNRKNNAVYKG